MFNRLLISCFFLVASTTLSLGAELREGFDRGRLNKFVWITCQADYPRLVTFDEDVTSTTTTRYLTVSIDENRGNVDTCANREIYKKQISELGLTPGLLEPFTFDDDVADLGPSMIAPDIQNLESRCEDGDSDKVQRNELRLLQKKHVHDVTDPHWYTLRFRTRGAPPPCGSSRWVMAQWKYQAASGWPHEFSQNPFLAQRFDNGVFHITVQNDRCRCMVAMTDGDPDRISDEQSLRAAPEGDVRQALKKSRPLKCTRSGKICTPEDFTVWTVDGGAPPLLPDPQKGWVTMSYRIKALGEEQGEIDIYANGRFIVRVSGHVGYGDLTNSRMKFKFGAYRDRIPGTHHMDVDGICISGKIDNCDRTVTPVVQSD
ncbi:heparin lyase I family protein [uncultured Roseibium sp.]|uniref:heparin lyase I family protein n=1 Tax=uncultured Roseibium sp. TaxID=1936171 RepID=UPI00262420CC|nr:heparin lyase I family protein [uncultured Roseibium sp.]